jgi:hypothetical protein
LRKIAPSWRTLTFFPKKSAFHDKVKHPGKKQPQCYGQRQSNQVKYFHHLDISRKKPI